MNDRLLKMLLCLVLVSADQMMKYQVRRSGYRNEILFIALTLFWSRLQKELINIITQLIQSGSSEMPLLLMAYFQTDEIGQVEDMVRTILRMQVPIRKLSSLFYFHSQLLLANAFLFSKTWAV
jgi:hypothetical protein